MTYVAVELQQMLEKDGCNFEALPQTEFSTPWLEKAGDTVPVEMTKREGSGSGGYSDHIFKHAAKELFGVEVTNLQYHNLRYILL